MPETFLVTGSAGFIGSHLAETLLARGQRVIGIDVVTDYYDPRQKWSNVERLQHFDGFQFHCVDLNTCRLETLLRDVDVVCHLAGQPGVRPSWGADFRHYARNNLLATQRLLEASRAASARRFVFASSSSVYGNAAEYPTIEESSLRPRSPYGVTKLACEHLINAYVDVFGMSVVTLRYFTVFGPGQRPDMAINRLIRSALYGEPFPLYGNGEQVRDFTYVSDVVDATIRASSANVPSGMAFNISGGASIAMYELLSRVEQAVGAAPNVVRLAPQPGDVLRTGANTEKARKLLGWQPTVGLGDGLTEQVRWHRNWRRQAAARPVAEQVG